MSVVGELIGGHHEFCHKGKTYRVRLIDQEVKDIFEKKMFAHAKECAKNIKDLMTEGEYAEHVHRIREDYMDGKFSLETERGVEFIKNRKGAVLLVSLLFGVTEHEALNLMVERHADVAELLKVVFKESYPVMESEEAGEPKNAHRPAPVGHN